MIGIGSNLMHNIRTCICIRKYLHYFHLFLYSLSLSLSLFLRVLVTQHTPSDTKGRGPGGHKMLESTSPPAASAASGGEGKARLNNKKILS